MPPIHSKPKQKGKKVSYVKPLPTYDFDFDKCKLTVPCVDPETGEEFRPGMRDLAASLGVSASVGKKNMKLPALREKVRPEWNKVLEKREAEAAKATASENSTQDENSPPNESGSSSSSTASLSQGMTTIVNEQHHHHYHDHHQTTNHHHTHHHNIYKNGAIKNSVVHAGISNSIPSGRKRSREEDDEEEDYDESLSRSSVSKHPRQNEQVSSSTEKSPSSVSVTSTFEAKSIGKGAHVFSGQTTINEVLES